MLHGFDVHEAVEATLSEQDCVDIVGDDGDAGRGDRVGDNDGAWVGVPARINVKGMAAMSSKE